MLGILFSLTIPAKANAITFTSNLLVNNSKDDLKNQLIPLEADSSNIKTNANITKQISETYIISSGGRGGKYYSLAKNMCESLQLINSSCTNIPSKSPLENMQNLIDNKSNIAFVQEDILHNISQKLLTNDRQQDSKIEFRKLINLYPATYNLVVREDSNFEVLNDLKGKKVHILGYQPTRFSRNILGLANISWQSKDIINFQNTNNLEDSFKDLCQNKIDGVLMLSGHISKSLSTTTKSCSIKFMEAPSKFMEKYIAYNPYYAKVVIPTYLYNKQDKINTLGVYVSLVTTTHMNNQEVYNFLTALFASLNNLEQTTPNLKEEIIVNIQQTDFKSIPYHEGALLYFKDQGWVK